MIFLIGYGFLDVPNYIAFMPLKPDLMKFYWHALYCTRYKSPLFKIYFAHVSSTFENKSFDSETF